MASRSVGELVAKFDRYATALPKAQMDAARGAGPVIKTAWIGVAGTAGLNPGRKVARQKWGVKYNVGKKGNLYIRYTGKLHLVNGDTKPHQIIPRDLKKAQGQALVGALTGVKVSRRLGGRGKRALKIGDNLRTKAEHPGTTGKNFWPNAHRAAVEIAPRIYWARTGTSLMTRSGFGR